MNLYILHVCMHARRQGKTERRPKDRFIQRETETHTHTHTPTRTRARMHARTHARTHTHIYIDIGIDIDIDIDTHTRIDGAPLTAAVVGSKSTSQAWFVILQQSRTPSRKPCRAQWVSMALAVLVGLCSRLHLPTQRLMTAFSRLT